MTTQQDWPAQLAAPLPADSISWRQDGRPTQRDGKYVARFVAYTDAQTVRERLDTVVPGAWDLTLELLPQIGDEDGVAQTAFKARLKVLDVVRECVGVGRDYKAAASDAFKRAAVRFGIGHELYSMGQVWVQVDGDGKYAKPLEDPAAVYAKKNGNALRGSASGARSEHRPTTDAGSDVRDTEEASGTTASAGTSPATAPSPFSDDEPSCPKCGGKTWDNRLSKRNPKAPDFKCRNRACDGVIWPPKKAAVREHNAGPLIPDEPPPEVCDDGPVPF